MDGTTDEWTGRCGIEWGVHRATAHDMSVMMGDRMLERLLKTNDDVQSHRREAVEQENIDEQTQQSKEHGIAWPTD